MAESPSHRFGQIVGHILEDLLRPRLEIFCRERNLYLDAKGPRPKARKGKKVSWSDKHGNSHDLDFVIEKDGTTEKQGRPVAFIEAAWRRYTKHSRNKAQEIQGALLPIAEQYHSDRPFLGAVVAGVFTKASLVQLQSVGFEVLYIEYEIFMRAFDKAGINARFDESTPDREFQKAVQAIEKLSPKEIRAVQEFLYEKNRSSFEKFFQSLRKKLDRMVQRIVLFPLFGDKVILNDFNNLEAFLKSFPEKTSTAKFHKYEIIIEFSNGDRIDGQFHNKIDLLDFVLYVLGK